MEQPPRKCGDSTYPEHLQEPPRCSLEGAAISVQTLLPRLLTHAHVNEVNTVLDQRTGPFIMSSTFENVKSSQVCAEGFVGPVFEGICTILQNETTDPQLYHL